MASVGADMQLADTNSGSGSHVALLLAVITALFACHRLLRELRFDRLKVFAVSRKIAAFMQISLVLLVALFAWLSVADSIGKPIPTIVLLVLPPFLTSFVLTVFLGLLAERDKFWNYDPDNRKTSLKWRNYWRIAVAPIISIVGPVGSAIAKKVPEGLELIRVGANALV